MSPTDMPDWIVAAAIHAGGGRRIKWDSCSWSWKGTFQHIKFTCCHKNGDVDPFHSLNKNICYAGMQKAKTSSYAHISSIVTGWLCPRVKMNSPDRHLGVLLDKRSRVAYPLEYKCLPDNYAAIFQNLVATFQFESTNAHNLVKISVISQHTRIVYVRWFESWWFHYFEPDGDCESLSGTDKCLLTIHVPDIWRTVTIFTRCYTVFFIWAMPASCAILYYVLDVKQFCVPHRVSPREQSGNDGNWNETVWFP